MNYKILDNGIVRELTTEEATLKNNEIAEFNSGAFDREIKKLRLQRNNLLAETDFYANSDVTMSDAMRTYRQALRDITNGLDTVAKVNAKEFPEKP